MSNINSINQLIVLRRLSAKGEIRTTLEEVLYIFL